VKPLRELSLSQARISRAQDNIKEFSQLLGEYLEGRPSRIQVDIDARGNGVIRVERREPIPDQLSILLVLQSRLRGVAAGFVVALLGAVLVSSSPERAMDDVAGVEFPVPGDPGDEVPDFGQ